MLEDLIFRKTIIKKLAKFNIFFKQIFFQTFSLFYFHFFGFVEHLLEFFYQISLSLLEKLLLKIIFKKV